MHGAFSFEFKQLVLAGRVDNDNSWPIRNVFTSAQNFLKRKTKPHNNTNIMIYFYICSEFYFLTLKIVQCLKETHTKPHLLHNPLLQLQAPVLHIVLQMLNWRDYLSTCTLNAMRKETGHFGKFCVNSAAHSSIKSYFRIYLFHPAFKILENTKKC